MPTRIRPIKENRMQIQIIPDGCLPVNGADASAILSNLIAEAADGTELRLPAGRFFLGKAVPVTGKKQLTIRGNDTLLVTHATPWHDPSEANSAFICGNCEDLTIERLHFTTDNPVNCAGRVTAIDPVNHTYDVCIDDEFPITGWEHFWGTDTCDEDGMPDYVIETYDTITREMLPDADGSLREKITGTRYEVLDGQNIRVFGQNTARLTVGHRVLYRYTIYGGAVFYINDCNRTVLRDIEIERCPGMGAVIGPRCTDAAFERFNIRVPAGSHALYAANADGIHVNGLSGLLHMKDCHFHGLGDDALNIHSMAGEIKTIGEDGHLHLMKRPCLGAERPLGAKWAQKGDLIRVYDRNTVLETGSFRVAGYTDSDIVPTDVQGSFEVGSILANDSFFAAVHLEDCTVRNTRARGILLQSHNMLIERCTFSGLSLPGLIIAPDVRFWYEVGPSENTEIRDCVFEKCGMNGSAANLGAIVVKGSHDAGASDYPAGVHKDIRIRDNTFRNVGTSGIFVSAASGVIVMGNRFEACRANTNPDVCDTDAEIVLCNCENIRIADNRGADSIVVKNGRCTAGEK